MKRLYTILATAMCLALVTTATAQAPSSRKIPFNNVTTTMTCAPDPSPCQRNIILRVFDAATAGTQIGVDEPQTVSVDDSSGDAISFVLGSTRPTGVDPNDFQSGSSRFLDVLNADTSTSVLAARIELTAVAFAVNPGPQGAQGPPGVVQAVSAANSSIVIGGTTANPTVGLNTTNTDARYLTLVGGTMLGNITFAAGQTFPASGLPNLAGEVTGAPNATVVSNAVAANTANAVVRRDGSGNFSASTLTLSRNLALPNTVSSSVGVLTLGGAPFLHNFGGQNTFVGVSAGNLSMSGTGNAAVGTSAFASNTTGGGNAAFGPYALAANTIANYNTAVGFNALYFNTTGQYNAAFGANALVDNTTANNNTAFGTSALQNNTIGSPNDAFGFHALLANTTGGGNAAFGDSALAANTTASVNSAFGVVALATNTTGGGNSAFGASALQNNTTGTYNVAFGANALANNTTVNGNAAFGTSALQNNTTGSPNDAFGFHALLSNTTGASNSAFGDNALYSNTIGGSNAAFGDHALYSNLSSNNSAFGASALASNTSGISNTAFGKSALSNLIGGSGNIAVGVTAGLNLTNEVNDIDIGHVGVAGESYTIRIGAPGAQQATFIAGISGATSAAGVNVFVNGNGQLGTTTSSRRFKQDIADVGSESDVLMKLRPVAFYYKPELDSAHIRQYGLVAEEVAQIAPGLVVFDQDGQPQTVRYHFVNAMLLNEVQKQRRLIEAQQSENEAQQRRLAAQQEQMQTMEQQMELLRRQNAEMQQQMKAVMFRLASVERSGGQGTQEAALAQVK